MSYPKWIDDYPEHRDVSRWQALVPRFDKIIASLSDDESKRHISSLLKFFLRRGDVYSYRPNPLGFHRYGYAAAGATPTPHSYIVDCGAYKGDTFEELRVMAKKSCHIYAIEPLNGRDVDVSYATWFHCGLGESSGLGNVVKYHPEKTGYKIGLGDGEIPIRTLDELFEDRPFSYMKMDIEGAEPSALRGGANVIRKYRPTIVACGYHLPEDMVEVPEILMELLSPCRLYAASKSPIAQTHYIAVPEERVAGEVSGSRQAA